MRYCCSFIKKKDVLFFIVTFIAIIVQVLLEIQIPKKMDGYLNMLQLGQISLKEALAFGMIMVALAIGATIIAIVSNYFAAKAGIDIVARMRIKAFDKMIDFEMEEIGKYGIAGLMNRVTADVMIMQNFFTQLIPIEIKSLFMIVLVIQALSNSHLYWKMITIIVISGIFLFLLSLLLQVMKKISKIQLAKDQLMRINLEHLTGIRVIHAFNAYDFQSKRFEKANKQLRDLEYFYNKKMSSFQPVAKGVFNWLSVAIYLMSSIIIARSPDADKSAIYANMVVYVSYTSFLVTAFVNFIFGGTIMPQVLIVIRRFKEITEQEISVCDGTADNTTGNESGTIEFRNVSFRYPGSKEDCLRNISFSVKEGETVAFIGSTGSGKTTLLNLITRFYDVTEGEILVDGVNVQNYAKEDLRKRIGYVPQKNILFKGTIAENIAYGSDGIDDIQMEKVIKAAQLSQSDSFIEEKSGKYEEQAEEGGSNFSGGQKQRLTIARVIYQNPEIFLFDDSFSALDYRTDKILRKQLRDHFEKATMLIVGQRISTIKNADQIFVLKNGEIVGSGKHDQLVDECEEYREILYSQITKEGEKK